MQNVSGSLQNENLVRGSSRLARADQYTSNLLRKSGDNMQAEKPTSYDRMNCPKDIIYPLLIGPWSAIPEKLCFYGSYVIAALE